MARYRTYTLRIESVDGVTLDAEAVSELAAGIQDAEDVVNDRLPDGFYCKIDDAEWGTVEGPSDDAA